MDTALLAARVLLAVVFGVAGMAKLRQPAASRATLEDFGVQPRLARIGARLLAPAELVVAVAALFLPTARLGALGAALLLSVFCVGIANALRQGRRPDCGCFGQVRPTPVGPTTLARNAALLGVALFVVIAGPGPAMALWLGAIAVVCAGAVVAGARRTAPSGIEVGQRAPAFDLTEARGGSRVTLASLRVHGQPVVLVFGNSGCTPCRDLFPLLSRWQASLEGHLRIAVVSIGDPQATRLLSEEHGLDDVLLDPGGEAWRAYGMPGNPSAATIAPDGRIEIAPVVGQDAIEEQIRLILRKDHPTRELWNRPIHAA
jgi:thiol-disulfide isomerase/thioredoxin